MEFQHLRVLVALAEEGSMTLAARRLSITQPAISLALSQLEREIGFALFHRSRKGLSLTTRATEIVDKARAVLRGAAEIETTGHSASPDTGEVRIAGRPGFMQYVFPHLVQVLERESPGIEIKGALSGNSEEVIAALRTGQADLCFAASPNIKSITAELLYHDPIWIAVAKGHPLTKKRVKYKDLAGLKFCVPVTSDRLRGPIDRILKRIGSRTLIATETNDYTVMKNLVATGNYAGFVYGHMMLSPDSERIVPLRISEMDLVRDLTILHRRDDLLPHVAHAREILIREAKRVLAKNAQRFGGR